MEAGMEKGRFLLIHKLPFLLSASFLVYLRLLTSPDFSVSAFLLQPDSDNILQGLPNIVHSQIQSLVFCKCNSQFNYESVKSLGMASFFCSLEAVRHLHCYTVSEEQLCPVLFDAICLWFTSSWQAVTDIWMSNLVSLSSCSACSLFQHLYLFMLGGKTSINREKISW